PTTGRSGCGARAGWRPRCGRTSPTPCSSAASQPWSWTRSRSRWTTSSGPAPPRSSGTSASALTPPASPNGPSSWQRPAPPETAAVGDAFRRQLRQFRSGGAEDLGDLAGWGDLELVEGALGGGLVRAPALPVGGVAEAARLQGVEGHLGHQLQPQRRPGLVLLAGPAGLGPPLGA